MPDIAPAMPLWVGFTGIAGLPESIGDALLTGSERQRLARLHHPLGRRQFIAGRWLLRQLQRHAGAAQVPLIQVGDGKPSLAASDGWHCNLAHSEELVACVLSRAPCGIDVEAIRPLAEMAGLLAHEFASEWHDWQLRHGAQPLPATEFYRWWTLKEAWLKATGGNLASMAQIRLAGLDNGTPHCAGPLARGPQQLLELELRPGYRTAACLLSDTVATVHCVEFTIQTST